jgi:hypothetical protein
MSHTLLLSSKFWGLLSFSMFGPLPVRILAAITFIARGLPKFENIAGTQGFCGSIVLLVLCKLFQILYVLYFKVDCSDFFAVSLYIAIKAIISSTKCSFDIGLRKNKSFSSELYLLFLYRS